MTELLIQFEQYNDCYIAMLTTNSSNLGCTSNGLLARKEVQGKADAGASNAWGKDSHIRELSSFLLRCSMNNAAVVESRFHRHEPRKFIQLFV